MNGSGSETEASNSSDDDAPDDLDDEMERLVLFGGAQSLRLFQMMRKNRNERNESKALPKTKRRRGAKGVVMCTDEAGNEAVLPPTMSLWYNIYVEHPNLERPRFHNRFRRRFRMPHASYLELLAKVTESPLFERWKPGKTDAVGNPCTPLSLLLLAALRYLGRGWTFDDLAESTAISEDVVRVFFHKFIEFGSTTLFDQYVFFPKTVEEAERQSSEYAKAGLPGAVGSMDATHVLVEKVRHSLRQSHLGAKLNSTARTYNIVCNHRRRILSTTSGHPSRWNDKTIVKFDTNVMNLYNGEALNDVPFRLYQYDSNGRVTQEDLVGAWILVDNGYHNWSITIPPLKHSTSRKEIRFSEWLESMRKDVECTFGIMKGRWRILKSGIRVHGLGKADQVWKTCCALHNMLLEVDGLDEQWNSGVPSDWEGEAGLHDQDDAGRFALGRLNNPGNAREYDSSGMGAAEDQQEEDENPVTPMMPLHEGTNQSIRRMSMKQFRSKLVEHFDIAFRRREIVWPVRNKNQAQNSNV